MLNEENSPTTNKNAGTKNNNDDYQMGMSQSFGNTAFYSLTKA